MPKNYLKQKSQLSAAEQKKKEDEIQRISQRNQELLAQVTDMHFEILTLFMTK